MPTQVNQEMLSSIKMLIQGALAAGRCEEVHATLMEAVQHVMQDGNRYVGRNSVKISLGTIARLSIVNPLDR
jgi:hypothetical protein